jgi:hypothetical protein
MRVSNDIKDHRISELVTPLMTLVPIVRLLDQCHHHELIGNALSDSMPHFLNWDMPFSRISR